MKLSLWVLIALALGVSALESETGDAIDLPCLLAQYQLPTIQALDKEDPHFDPEDDLLNLTVEIPAEVVASAVSGYKASVLVGSTKRSQFLYLRFSKGRSIVVLDSPDTKPSLAHPDLYRISGASPYSWDLVERKGNRLQLWGVCSDDFQGSYDCLTHLSFEGFSVSYDVHQVNLPVYKELEAFLRHQIKACQDILAIR